MKVAPPPHVSPVRFPLILSSSAAPHSFLSLPSHVCLSRPLSPPFFSSAPAFRLVGAADLLWWCYSSPVAPP